MKMEVMLRQAYPSADASAILADPAWPVLANAMHRLNLTSGADLQTLLKKVAAAQPVHGRLPAVHAAAALRSAAESSAHLRTHQHNRAKHQQRLHQHGVAADGPTAISSASPGIHQAVAKNARLVSIAFPRTARQALNGSSASTPPGPQTPDRMRRTQHATSPSAETHLDRS
jgi:hypothetical protein